MKRMLDELKKLNNEEKYEVPVDFRTRVISEISAEKKKSKLSSYIISGLSAAAVAVIAVVVTGNSLKFTTLQNDNFETQVNLKQENEYAADGEDTLLFSMSTNRTNAIEELYGEYEDLNPDISINSEKQEELKKQYSDEIIDMLKINGMSAELLDDDSVKVKAKKEDVEMVLYYFDGEIEITEQGEYCIIKEK